MTSTEDNNAEQGYDDIVEDKFSHGQQSTSEQSGGSFAGIRPIGFFALVFALCASTTYFIPQLESYRPWHPGTELPFSSIFEFRMPIERPDITGGAQSTGATQSDEELLAGAVQPSNPNNNDQSSEAEAPAPQTSDVESSAPRVPPERFRGLTRQIEEFSGDELDFFYGLLASVGREESDALARISVFSVSTNGSDRVTSAMRHQLQDFFGDGGKGWVNISPGWTYHGHQDVEWDPFNWRTAVVNRRQGPFERYGYGGVLASNMGPRSYVSFGTVDEGPSNREVSLFRIFYQTWSFGGSMSLAVDGQAQPSINVRSQDPQDLIHEIRVDRGAHELRIGVDEGHVRLYGVTMEKEGPGVVVDGIALIGASVRVLYHFDTEHLARQVRQRQPDLLFFWLGGNDAAAMHFTQERFREDYGENIGRVRAGRPEASCLVVSILDKGTMRGGMIRTRHNVESIVEAQRQVAQDQNCAFFNLYEATGGNGTMARWYRSRPRLAVDDFTHLTEAGTRVVGSLLARALLKGYDDYLASGGR